jgi:hypothetical protein
MPSMECLDLPMIYREKSNSVPCLHILNSEAVIVQIVGHSDVPMGKLASKSCPNLLQRIWHG